MYLLKHLPFALTCISFWPTQNSLQSFYVIWLSLVSMNKPSWLNCSSMWNIQIPSFSRKVKPSWTFILAKTPDCDQSFPPPCCQMHTQHSHCKAQILFNSPPSRIHRVIWSSYHFLDGTIWIIQLCCDNLITWSISPIHVTHHVSIMINHLSPSSSLYASPPLHTLYSSCTPHCPYSCDVSSIPSDSTFC